MKSHLIALQERLSASYWFVPSIMIGVTVVLSVITTELDESVNRELTWVLGLIYVDSPEGAREMLSAIASSMITVAGVVFSLTMVVLSLTSQQYGPLVLRDFMQDKGTQVVLGVFMSTFIYCLLALRTIQGSDDNVFVPHISVLVGLGLAFVSIAFLIYFIHHVSESIQAPSIVSRITGKLLEAIERLYPSEIGVDRADIEEHTPPQDIQAIFHNAASTRATQTGYLQVIDDQELLKVSRERDVVLRIDSHPGQFVVKGTVLANVAPSEKVDDELQQHVESAFIFGEERTQSQDVEFMFLQLVGVAVRALSPGINDPYTAIMCIDRLTEALCLLGNRERPSIYRYDEQHQLRVCAYPAAFTDLFHTSFDQIRHYGRQDIRVVMHLLKALKTLVQCTQDASRQQLFHNYADLVYSESQQNFSAQSEREQIDRVYHDLIS